MDIFLCCIDGCDVKVEEKGDNRTGRVYFFNKGSLLKSEGYRWGKPEEFRDLLTGLG